MDKNKLQASFCQNNNGMKVTLGEMFRGQSVDVHSKFHERAAFIAVFKTWWSNRWTARWRRTQNLCCLPEVKCQTVLYDCCYHIRGGQHLADNWITVCTCLAVLGLTEGEEWLAARQMAVAWIGRNVQCSDLVPFGSVWPAEAWTKIPLLTSTAQFHISGTRTKRCYILYQSNTEYRYAV